MWKICGNSSQSVIFVCNHQRWIKFKYAAFLFFCGKCEMSAFRTFMVVQRRACRLKAMRLDVLFDQKTTSASIANEALMSQNREKWINVCHPRKRMSVRKAENLCVFAYFKIWRIIKRCFFSINNIRKIIQYLLFCRYHQGAL